MGVTFTPNIGLAKPDNTEVAKEWTNSTNLVEDNRLIVIDKMDITLSSYSPVLKAQTTDPLLGVGTIRGEYQDIEGIVVGSFTIEFLDPGINAGSGAYAISLPAAADGTFHNIGTAFNSTPGAFSVVGNCYFFDSSNVALSGECALDLVTVSGVSYVQILPPAYTTPAKTAPTFTNAVPSVVANADTFSGFFVYKRT